MNTILNPNDHLLSTIWHPCSQMKDYESFPPLDIKSATGSYLQLRDGRRIIDAISSWWCKSLGHGHPRLRQALHEQAQHLEHVILANTTNETIQRCSESISNLSAAHNKVFYAGDGSCAVEIALKMAIHAQQLAGRAHKTELLALQNGYHGETALTLSVSDVGLYKKPYASLLQPTTYLGPLPEVLGPNDPAWHTPITNWEAIDRQLEPLLKNAAALIVEPIVQGAGGMRIYHPDTLRHLREITQKHNIYLIADEIMTGIGRTGVPLACQHAGITADLICLSKGLTSGWLPFSAVLVPDDIYALFYDDYESGKAFLHSHTYCGNALAARLAIETLQIMHDESIYQQANDNGELMRTLMQSIADETGLLGPVRQIGSIVAAELQSTNNIPRAGYHVYQRAVELGALLRPLGNTIYWLPPLNTPQTTIHELASITKQALLDVCAA